MFRFNKIWKKRLKAFLYYRSLRKEVISKRKINVGSGNVDFDDSWFSCDIKILDITQKLNWKKILGRHRLTNIFAEHVWEHLSEKDTLLANQNCYMYLKKGGRLRLAVPDGFHPSEEYINYVKPNGIGLGADDHKILYNYISLREALEDVGFQVELLEYWDENGQFHFTNWSNEHGKVKRSKRYDERNSDGKLKYTSLILDAIK